jgi:transglutaminase/protease-like cytokinesis protein 3
VGCGRWRGSVALHDVVVARVSYDDVALAAIRDGRWTDVPSMEAEDVFARGRGVCEGYARLMTALGTAAGVEIAYVTGFARSGVRDGASLEGNEHAWNAAKLDGHWYPIDATWDDGKDRYSTTYLLTPPSVFIRDHFPDDTAWQLLAAPLSVSDFLRQPATSVELDRLGLTLRSPDRSQVSAAGSLEVVLDNPRQRDVMASISPADVDIDDHARARNCGYTIHAATARLRCTFGDGAWRIDLWGSPRSAGALDYLGSIWVNSR